MPAIDHRRVASDVFATFEGDLDRDRIDELFAHRSLKDRLRMLAVWLLASVFVFVVAWLMGAGNPVAQGFRWSLAGAVSLSIFGFGLLQQFAFWHRRRWMRSNKILTGNYRITLTDQHVDLQAERVAFRMPYFLFGAVDSGLSCVRLSLDADFCRALLLPSDDVHPQISASQVEAFLRDRLRDGKAKSLELTWVSDRDLPVPLGHPEGTDRIEFAGPLRQGDVLEALEANHGDKLRSRIRGTLYVLMGSCLAGLAISMTVGAANGNRFPLDGWIKLGALGIVLLLVAIGAMRMRSLKADVRADPDAPASQLRGWVSALGMMAFSGQGAIAVMWQACDAIEIIDNRIVVRFWHGDFQIVGRKMFRTESEFDQAVTWVQAATSQRTH